MFLFIYVVVDMYCIANFVVCQFDRPGVFDFEAPSEPDFSLPELFQPPPLPQTFHRIHNRHRRGLAIEGLRDGQHHRDALFQIASQIEQIRNAMREVNLDMRHRQGLSEEQRVMILSRIPISKYEKARHGDFDSCSICIGDFEEGARIKAVQVCQHIFHEDCLDEWVHKSRSTNIVCPVCRSDI